LSGFCDTEFFIFAVEIDPRELRQRRDPITHHLNVETASEPELIVCLLNLCKIGKASFFYRRDGGNDVTLALMLRLFFSDVQEG
jgi:hypothetical protein